DLPNKDAINPSIKLIPDPDFKFDENKLPRLQIPAPKHDDFKLIVSIAGRTPGKDEVVELKKDQEFSLGVTSDTNAWVYIWSFEADGSVVQILPNRGQNGYVLAGQTLVVPDKLSADSLSAGAPAGVEYLRIVA